MSSVPMPGRVFGEKKGQKEKKERKKRFVTPFEEVSSSSGHELDEAMRVAAEA